MMTMKVNNRKGPRKYRKVVMLPRVIELWSSGRSIEEIAGMMAEETGMRVHKVTISRWLKEWKESRQSDSK